jgi:hypothetical protein
MDCWFDPREFDHLLDVTTIGILIDVNLQSNQAITSAVGNPQGLNS